MKRMLLIVLGIVLTGPVWAGPVDKSVDAILQDYFKIQSALAGDSTEGIDAAAAAIEQKAKAIEASDAKIQAMARELQAAAGSIQGKDLESARTAFFELSKPLLAYLHQHHSAKDGYYRFYCPMAQKGWIQSEKETRNPYYGSSMLACGNLIQ